MQKKILVIFLIVLGAGIVVALWGYAFKEGFGPGLADFDYKINDVCTLEKTSAHMVSVRCADFEKGIEPKVVKIGWSKDYIVAITHPVTKREYPNNPNNDYSVPDEAVTYWWILDLKNKTNLGPILSEQVFEDQMKKFNIDNITFTTPEKLGEQVEKTN